MNPTLFQKNRLLSELCTLGIGGTADFYIEIRSIDEMKEALSQCHTGNLHYFILGKGSNCLFDDEGFNGAILHNKIDFFEHSSPGSFHIGAGYSFSLLGTQTARLGFGGLEFASGIPASVGGAVYMNAGANGGETSTYLESVDYIDERGNFHILRKEELQFSYRYSSFQNLKGAIVGATFALQPSGTARKQQIEIVRHRQNTQPYKDKSAGCIFQNPPQNFAGQLIDQCGLKGAQFGGAKVSNLHANFLINAGNATSKDFLELISHIQRQIHEQTGIQLKSEVRYVASKRIPR
ncbi:UDP-N-acetylenolpyruvoylglucosamine reductase [Chlamydiales bacterium STE3]|nr:UDP-N-acetylenolpyruvoylglucosamine reductase [Chlamydiales bacterium STE3]